MPAFHHSVEILDEFLRAALVGDIEVVAGIVQIQARSAVRVGRSEDTKNRQLREVGLPETLGRGGNIA